MTDIKSIIASARRGASLLSVAGSADADSIVFLCDWAELHLVPLADPDPDTFQSRLSKFRLTPRQIEVVEFIFGYVQTNRCSPTMQQIGTGLGISKVSAFEHVTALEKKKALRREKRKARSIQLRI